MKRPKFTNRTNIELTSIIDRSNIEEDNSNRTRWKNIIKSNNYYRTNYPRRLLTNEKNSTSCIIQ
jgi:hypothetical protein